MSEQERLEWRHCYSSQRWGCGVTGNEWMALALEISTAE